MNKKLAVLLVVPILLAMGGTFAFSAFSVGPSSGPFHLNLGTQAYTTATSGREHTKYISETDFTSNLQVNVQANLTNNSFKIRNEIIQKNNNEPGQSLNLHVLSRFC